MRESPTPVALRRPTNGSKAGRQDRESQADQHEHVSAATNLTHVQELERLAQKMCRILVDLATVSKGMNANTKFLSESIGHLRQGLKGMTESVDQIKVD